jgi:acyl-CoA dehydrogenase
VTQVSERDADLQPILDGLCEFITRTVLPLEDTHRDLLGDPTRCYDERGARAPETQDLCRQVRVAAAEAGYYTMFAPEQVGGAGLGAAALYAVWETIGRTAGGGRLLPYETVGHWTSGPSFLLSELRPATRAKVAEDVMAGRETTCFGMSEPDAGSDAWSMRTRAERDGDGWVLNGTKQWISHAAEASYAFIWAVTDEQKRRERTGGITCFFVPADSPGFHVDSVIRLFERVGGNEAIVSLSDVRVSDDQIVGQLDDGFALALRGVSDGRLYNAGHCVGLAQWALDIATAHAQTRRAFGQPIASYQGVSFMLADSAIDIYAAKTMSEDCARRIDRGEAAVKELSMVKAFTTEATFRAIDRCMQVCGAIGLTNEMRLVEAWHHARMVQIADGTGQIMRRNIARQILKHGPGR